MPSYGGTTIEGSHMILVRVKISDFDRFWSVFESAGAEKRAAYGSGGATVYRNEDDPNEVVLLFDWDRGRFEEFMSDPAVRETQRSGGAQGPPVATFLSEPRQLPQ